MRLAALRLAAPSTLTSMNLRAPSPSRTTCWARSTQQLVERAPEGGERADRRRRRSARRASRRAGREDHQRVGGRGVAVDGDRVERALDRFRQQRLQRAGAAIGASVKTKDSIVAMSGAIMPAPLAMPLMITSASPSLTRAVAIFGKVSVVMIALAASDQRVGAGVGDQRVETRAIRAAIERLADDAGRSHVDFVRRRADRLGGRLGDVGDRGRADAAGEGVGVAGIDDQRARPPLRSDGRGTSRPAPRGISSG